VSTPEDTIDRSWWPSTADLAALLHVRTQGAAPVAPGPTVVIDDLIDATYRGDFDATTSPTGDQAERLLELAVGAFLGLTGGHTPCSDTLALVARTQVVLFAAMLTEAGYRPEATSNDQTAFEAIRKVWAQTAQTVADTIRDRCPLPGGEPGPVGEGGSLPPTGRFPRFRRSGVGPVPPMIGRRWPGGAR